MAYLETLFHNKLCKQEITKRWGGGETISPQKQTLLHFLYNEFELGISFLDSTLVSWR